MKDSFLYKCLKHFFFFFLLLIILSLNTCYKSTYTKLDKLIINLALDDKTIDTNDWQSLTIFVKENKRDLAVFFDKDKLRENKLCEYIIHFFSKRRPAVDVQFIGVGKNKDIAVKFYLERSGSMVAYDAPQGNGYFKSAIVQLLNNLPETKKQNKIYVVNSTINEYPKGFDQFISDVSIFEATKGLGNPSYTDFSSIFSTILKQTKQNELSILVTDMIYSTQKMEVISAQKIFAEAQGMTQAVFNEAVKDKSMLIIRMMSSYNGQYYPYNSPSKGITYNGNRPYYIILVGDNVTLNRIAKDKKYASFTNFSALKGYQNSYLFSATSPYKPFYSLLLNHSLIRGRFRIEHGEGRTITKIKNIEAEENSGNAQLVLAVDLKSMLLDLSYLTNVANYEILSKDKVELKAIKPLAFSDLSATERRYAGSATHLFILSCKSMNHDQSVKIKLLNKLPKWVFSSSTDNDEIVDANKTFGLKYLLEGIYAGYKKQVDGKPSYFELDLNFKN